MTNPTIRDRYIHLAFCPCAWPKHHLPWDWRTLKKVSSCTRLTQELMDSMQALILTCLYRYDKMEKVTFMARYKPVCEKPFDSHSDMRRYCINDVEVLRMTYTIYRETLMECTQIDLFLYTTLASYCM